MEDLWCFNDERVARAIRRAAIPVVTGIGHEIDFTIADFAADVRAPTPSGAAELVVPDRGTLLATVRSFYARLQQAAQRQLRNALQRHEQLLARLQRAHPGSRLQQQVQRLDDLDTRLRRAWDLQRTRMMQRLQLAQRHLDAISPLATLQRGYAIVTGPGGEALMDESQVKPGDTIEARVARGRIRAQVLAPEP
jgi:exodeoxyribonuclease VII large subunit